MDGIDAEAKEVKNQEECRHLCDNEISCLNFEFSPKDKLCFLNDKNPHGTGARDSGYHVCVNGKSSYFKFFSILFVPGM